MASYNWTCDELILALDLYFREPEARGNRTHREVEKLSDFLNRLPIHPRGDREDYFRNPSGFAMKLSNFLRFDPEYEGVGLERGGRLDREIWNQFFTDRQRLHDTARKIREAAELEEVQEDGPTELDQAEAKEGRILTRLHRVRERSRKLVQRKKSNVLKETGRLACEVCGLDFEETYGERDHGFAECHHRVPVADL